MLDHLVSLAKPYSTLNFPKRTAPGLSLGTANQFFISRANWQCQLTAHLLRRSEQCLMKEGAL